jgi:beta-1,4-mannooligosaccharide/beta-1,4-mannosyl-N-acetylglucosamine phosphorylase
MAGDMKTELFKRYSEKPLIHPDMLPIKANGVLNPGVAEVDGEVYLLLRIEDRRGLSQIRVAKSANGIDGWDIAERPLLEPGVPECSFEEWGCEDARVTPIGYGRWIIAYTAYCRYGPAVALATTEDFKSVDRLGIALSPTNKDATVFPQKFADKWIMLHRPIAAGQEHVWHISSADLVHWSHPGMLLPVHSGPWWDGFRVGVGAPPLRTDRGWLLIYHGVKEMGQRPIYRLGLALLDLEDPCKVIARGARWVFAPETDYEQHGLVPGVVYTCGAIVRGDEVWMYYGAADTFIGLATCPLNDLVDFVLETDYLNSGENTGEAACSA